MATVYYTLEDISKNNGKNGNKTWIVIKNCVYDVTAYLEKDEHPGGIELIEEYAGKDATKAFDNAGHSGDAKALLKQFKIGELAEEDRNKPKTKVATKTENGKSAKSANVTDYEKRGRRSCLSIITCGLMA